MMRTVITVVVMLRRVQEITTGADFSLLRADCELAPLVLGSRVLHSFQSHPLSDVYRSMVANRADNKPIALKR